MRLPGLWIAVLQLGGRSAWICGALGRALRVGKGDVRMLDGNLEVARYCG